MKKDLKTMIVIIALGFGVLGFSSVKSKVSDKLTKSTSFMNQAQVNIRY